MSERRELSAEEIAALEAELERITVDDVLLQTVVSLLNLGARKAGLGAPSDKAPEPDLEQLHQAIEGARALIPLLEKRHGDKLGPVRETLSRLQLTYAQLARGAAARPAPEPEGAPAEPGRPEPGPAQRSGRLWVPGQ
jgi:hypothetical protein